MTQQIEHLRLVGAETLRDGRIAPGCITVAGGCLSDGGGGGAMLDLSGYWLLPGIVDLHGDAFERHLAPRPSAPFPADMALIGVDRDAAVNGVTTAWMAQSWSWEGGSRGPDFALDFLAAHTAYKPRALCDLRVQLRCETHTVETGAHLIDAVRRFGVDYVIFNDHLDEALVMARENPADFAAWGARAGRSAEEHLALVHRARDLAPRVPRYLCNLATAFDALGVRYGSHDDPDTATRDYYAMIGAKICEFPTAHAPARVARAAGDPVLMGAPNVVRGGSQSGNIAACSLIRQGLCDALVSDYHYPSLAQAAFAMADAGLMPLAQAWAMVSAAPARIIGLRDRGAIADGARADLVMIDRTTRQIEGTMAAGRWAHLSGRLAARLGQGGARAMAHAAE